MKLTRTDAQERLKTLTGWTRTGSEGEDLD